jgi:hypothetical protein
MKSAISTIPPVEIFRTRAGDGDVPPNQYHVSGNGIRLSYCLGCPGGAGPIPGGGPTIVAFADGRRSLRLDPGDVRTVTAADLGTCVKMTLAVGATTSTMATLRPMLCWAR